MDESGRSPIATISRVVQELQSDLRPGWFCLMINYVINWAARLHVKQITFSPLFARLKPF